MFWHFLKVVYSRACESRGVWIKVRKLKTITHLSIAALCVIINLAFAEFYQAKCEYKALL